MGKLTNLNPPAPIADSELPSTLARDAEVAAAINAHLGASDPHSQYLLPSEADAKYLTKTEKAADCETVDGIATGGKSRIWATSWTHFFKSGSFISRRRRRRP